MSISERIWLFYGPHAKRESDGFVDTNRVASRYTKVISLLVSNEGALAHERYLPVPTKPWTREQWSEWIDDCLLDCYERIWIPELNIQYTERLGYRIMFEYDCLVAWYMTNPPKPYKPSKGTLSIYSESRD